MLKTGWTFYKIMDINPETGDLLSLFHGTNGTRVHEQGRWLQAQIRPDAYDGSGQNGKRYKAGFHIMESLPQALEYLSKFRNTHFKVIVRCRAGRLWPKPQSPAEGLWLAEMMFIEGIAVNRDEVQEVLNNGRDK